MKLSDGNKKVWLKISIALVGMAGIGLLFYSCLKEEVDASKQPEAKIVKTVEPAEGKTAKPIPQPKATKPLIAPRTDAGWESEKEEDATELNLELPIFLEIPAHLQTACNLYFQADGTELLNKACQDALKAHIGYLKDPANANKLIIEGYASPEECSTLLKASVRKKAQFDLSKERAECIQKLMIEQGVPAERIEIAAKGSAEPREAEAEEGKSAAINRRVLLIYTTA